VFLFALALAPNVIWWQAILTFLILHFMVYPASNGYNSYFDKDENSIGGLKFPPKVSKDLYWAALALDVVALALGFLISNLFVAMIFIYGMISKAYSHPSVRLKSKPIGGWLAAGIFQGYFTFLMAIVGVSGFRLIDLGGLELQFAAVLTSLMLFGSYPMTQIYQHEEDGNRGDRTLSLMLGVLGTFNFTAGFFSVSTALFSLFFVQYYGWVPAVLFLTILSPILLYFSKWYLAVRKDQTLANYDRTMKLNWISATCLNAFFMLLYYQLNGFPWV
jgi:1,4-dihydroxy-2-naphthoate octaprenyltransferase